jgi:Na+-translocating ferredoxin:NAD+ oxidoreductase RnfD subunit
VRFEGESRVAKREKTATESLLQIALGLEIIVVFFGALALNGLRLYSGPVVLVGSIVTVLVLLVLYRAVQYRWGQLLGHVIQVALLASFWWDVAIGLSFAVVVAFWVFGAIRGPMLDRNKPESSQ